MNMARLFTRELRFRSGSFRLATVAVAAAAACVVGSRAFLASHDIETDRLVAALESRAADRMTQLRDEARIFSKSLGFNILLLPEGQDAGRLYAENRSTHFFTPDQVRALGEAEFATLNHLLPMLRYRLHWDAYGGDVVLMGVEGEIYIKSPRFQKPIEEAIDPGRIHIGDAIRQRLDLKTGDTVRLLDADFTVHRLLPQKGNVDDISILMNLGDVQRLSGLTNKVGGVLALSCNCAAGDLAPIRMELSRVVEGVQVVEFSVRAHARQKAREAIGQGTRQEMADIEASRGALRSQVARFAVILVALVTLGTVLLLVVLTVASVRERRAEVAMLRALGLGAGRILSLFLYKALLVGLAGGILGSLGGLLAARFAVGTGAAVSSTFTIVVILATALIAMLSSIVPAVMAARTDPAVILNQE